MTDKKFTDAYAESHALPEHIVSIIADGLPLTDIMRQLGITGAWQEGGIWLVALEGYGDIGHPLPAAFAEKLGLK